MIIPIFIQIGIVYYLWEYVNRDYSIYILFPVLFGVILFVFHGPIDHWYQTKYPIKLDLELQSWLNKHFSYYNFLKDSEKKTKFEQRLSLYISGRAFSAVGSEVTDVPEDIKCMVAAHGVQMCMGFEDYLIGDIDRIFLYKHPFPTPKFQALHSVETDAVDGLIILNYNLLAHAVLNPKEYYNIAYHAYAEVILNVYGEEGLHLLFDDLDKFKQIIHWTEDDIKRQIGLPILNHKILHIHHFFVFNEQYKSAFPSENDILLNYFKL